MVRLLTALVLAATPTEDPHIDWAAVRRNTAAYEAELQSSEARTGVAGLDDALSNRLAAAQALAGPVPAGAARLVPHAAQGGAAASAEVEEAMALLMRRRGQVEQTFAEAELQLSRMPDNTVLKQRLAEQKALFEGRMAALSGRLSDIGAGLSSPGVAGDGLLRFGRQLVGRDEATALAEVMGLVDSWSPAPRAILGASTLNYVHGELTPQPLSSASITPAYAAGGSAALALEDTTLGREVELSEVVRAKADSLTSPLQAYEFVKNELALDWYLGALKGSTETLREGRGNDADLSSLLIALLRAKQIPARFVRGTIELPVERLADLMGLLTGAEVDQLYGRGTPFVLDAGRRGRVLQALTAAGIPYTPTLSGGQPTLVRLSHIWVEAYLPYANYRGVGSSPEGKQWVALDAAIPGGAKYAATPATLDALAAMNVDAQALTSGYLLDGASPSPLEYYRAQVRSYLTANAPGVDYSSTLRRVSQRTEQLDLLPGSLPYTVVSVQEESAFLPDAMKHRVRVTAGDGAGLFVDVTLPLHQLVAHRSVLAYQPATDTDVVLIQQNGGALYGAPATLVQVVASIRVDGEEKAVGSRAIPLGADTSWSLELLLPNGTSRRIDNSLIAGNAVALGLGGPFNRYTEPTAHVASDKDGFAQRFLYARAVAYANEWTMAEEELAALSQVVLVRPTANVAFVQNQLHVESTLGVRQRVEFRGLEIDADLRTVVPLELVAGRARTLLELSGHQGSFLEAKVLIDGIGEKAISATEVVREANRRGTEVLQLSPANVSTELPRLTASAEVLRDVADQLALGREVTIPISPLTIENWAGSGYISVEPGSREAGYFLSGIVSGGTTVISPRFWEDQQLREDLEANPVESTTDLTLIARIIRLEPERVLKAVVGQPLAAPIGVLVTTLDGTPVAGAPVTFRRLENAVDQPFVGPAQASAAGPWMERYVVPTNRQGLAFAMAKPDTVIVRESGGTSILFRPPGLPNEQLVGSNWITAETCASPCGPTSQHVVMADTFHLIGMPDALAELLVPTDNPVRPPGIDFGRSLAALALDQWGNRLSNQTVWWAPDPVEFTVGGQDFGAFVELSALAAAAPLFLDPTDVRQQQQLATTTSVLGFSQVGWIASLSPTIHEIVAQGCLPSGVRCPVEGRYSILVRNPPGGFIFRAMVPQQFESWTGIVGTSLPAPLRAQVLHATGAGASWTPVTGTEPELNLSSFAVTLRTLNDVGVEIGSPVTSGPTDTTQPPYITALQDGHTTVFWPKYVAGQDTLVTTAEVKQWQTDAQGNRVEVKVCCGETWTLFAPANFVDVVVMRARPGSALVDAPNGVASVDDVAVGFKITSHASSKMWARIRQHPNVTGEELVLIPDATLIARHPNDASLLELPANFDTTLAFGVYQNTSGGTVSVEVLADEPTTPSAPPIPAELSSTAVTELVLQPNVQFVDVDGVPGEALGLNSPEDPNPIPFFLRFSGSAATVAQQAELQSFYPDGGVLQAIPIVLQPGLSGPFYAIRAQQFAAPGDPPPTTALTIDDGPPQLLPVALPTQPGQLAVLPGGIPVRVTKMGTSTSPLPDPPFWAQIGNLAIEEQTSEGGDVPNNPAYVCTGPAPPVVRNGVARFAANGAPFAADTIRWTIPPWTIPVRFVGEFGPWFAGGRTVPLEALQSSNQHVPLEARVGLSKISKAATVNVVVAQRQIRKIVAYRLTDSEWTEDQIRAQLDEASNVWAQCCLEFLDVVIVPLTWPGGSDFSLLSYARGEVVPDELRQLTESHDGSEGVVAENHFTEIYFVKALPPRRMRS